MQPSSHTLRRSILTTALALATASLAPLAQAQPGASYPSKPITMVVPYPPGGSNDSFARQIAKELGEVLKQTVIVDNRPGASGNTGTGQVAKAPADGYTLVAVSSSMTTNAAIQPRLPFDAVKSLAPVAMLARGPMVIAVNNEFAARTPAELVQAVKANPGKFNYATSGTGSVNHFATEMLRSMAPGFDITHVPYKGQGPAVTDVIGNQVQMMISSGPSILPMVRNGKLRAIVITSLKRSAQLPETPTLAESGYKDFEAASWYGVLAPAGTPAAIVKTLNQAINQALTQPDVAEKLKSEGGDVLGGTPEKFSALLKAEVPRWAKIVKDSGASLD